MLQIKDLGFSYSRRNPLIGGFSMELSPGSVCGLLGRNGAGKTTLLYLICGLLRPQKGHIDFNGYVPVERKVGFLSDVFIVPEEFRLPAVTLESFVKVNAPFYPRFDQSQMEYYLDIFDLSPNLDLGKLSMGQKKKAYISFAMATNTALLILDEPTNGLDISSKRNFRRAVSSCMNDEKSIIISTHQVYDVDKILDHVIITDRKGVLLNASMFEISEKLHFNFTTDRPRAADALLALEVPGGYNIVERAANPGEETDVNLETLFELVTGSPSLTSNIFKS